MIAENQLEILGSVLIEDHVLVVFLNQPAFRPFFEGQQTIGVTSSCPPCVVLPCDDLLGELLAPLLKSALQA